MPRRPSYILSIDPGRAKCGVAVVDSAGKISKRQVVVVENLIGVMQDLEREFQPIAAIIGDGTGTEPLIARLKPALKCSIHVVDEKHTSEEARRRFLEDHPPKGLGKLVPQSLRVPDEPYDDYVAVILAERWWDAEREKQASTPK